MLVEQADAAIGDGPLDEKALNEFAESIYRTAESGEASRTLVSASNAR
jgi:hypothetical protein